MSFKREPRVLVADFETSVERDEIDLEDLELKFKEETEGKNLSVLEKEIIYKNLKRLYTESANPEEVWVYAWGVYDIKTEQYIKGRSLDDFMQLMLNQDDGCEVFFHNLKFDGSYILSWLLNNEDYTYISDVPPHSVMDDNIPGEKISLSFFKEELKQVGLVSGKRAKKDFLIVKTAINEMGIWYNIEITHAFKGEKYKTIKIYDSLKLLSMSIKKIGSDFLKIKGLQKEEMDHTIKRTTETQLTKDEEHYIRSDVEILGKAVNKLKNEYNITKYTAASASLANFKEVFLNQKNGGEFDRIFPKGTTNQGAGIADESYKGGISYVNPIYKNKIIGNTGSIIGVTIDANSLYPSVMTNDDNLYPYGSCEEFSGKYEKDEKYPLYIQRFECMFELKPFKIPLVNLKPKNLKNGNEKLSLPFGEYLTSSKGEYVELVMNTVDFEIFKENYNIYDIHYIEGVKYMAMNRVFNDYIEFWAEQKEIAVTTGNSSLKNIAKLYMNSLYGKFGTKYHDISWKIPHLKENGAIGFKLTEPTTEDPVYMAMSSFIIAYARKELNRIHDIVVRDIQKNKNDKEYDPFAYCDTDSLHLICTMEDLKDSELWDYVDGGQSFGKWKVEGILTKALYIRSKTYMEMTTTGELCTACAGLPKDYQSKLDFNTFKEGAIYEKCKFGMKMVKGGIALTKTDFKIKE